MRKDRYIVTTARQKNYLYSLGFDYTIEDDRKNPGREIYLFDRTDNLSKAIDFYCHMRYCLRNGGEFDE